MAKSVNWRESFASTHLEFNQKSWNFGRTLFSIASLGSIAFFMVMNDFSPAFKVVYNVLWFPFFQIGLTYSCFMMGFDYYTDRPIKWKAWMKSHAGFYKTYYFWVVVAVVAGMVALGALQASGYDLSSFMAPAGADTSVVPWDSYTRDPNSWYGFLVLYAAVPLQNTYVVGTSMVTAWFWFIFFGPFFYNWMNRVKFSTCTFWMVLGLIAALFFSGWTDVFWTSPDFKANVPGYEGVGNYTTWYLIVYMLLAGFYIRKYTRVIPWRIALLWFVVIAAACIAIETALDFEGADGQLSGLYSHAPGFNNFYIGASFCSLPIMVLSWLAINFCAQWKGPGTKPGPRVAAWNRFNVYSAKYIGDLFALIGLGTKAVFGLLIMKIALGMDVRAFNAIRIQVGDGSAGRLISADSWG